MREQGGSPGPKGCPFQVGKGGAAQASRMDRQEIVKILGSLTALFSVKVKDSSWGRKSWEVRGSEWPWFKSHPISQMFIWSFLLTSSQSPWIFSPDWPIKLRVSTEKKVEHRLSFPEFKNRVAVKPTWFPTECNIPISSDSMFQVRQIPCRSEVKKFNLWPRNALWFMNKMAPRSENSLQHLAAFILMFLNTSI